MKKYKAYILAILLAVTFISFGEKKVEGYNSHQNCSDLHKRCGPADPNRRPCCYGLVCKEYTVDDFTNFTCEFH